MAASGLKVYQPLRDEPSERRGFQIMSVANNHQRTITNAHAPFGSSATPSSDEQDNTTSSSRHRSRGVLSAMESSNNPNNQARLVTSSTSSTSAGTSSSRLFRGGAAEQRDASGTALSFGGGGSSHNNHYPRTAAAAASSSSSSHRPHHHRDGKTLCSSNASSTHSRASTTTINTSRDLGEDAVVIEEKRKRQNGSDGYTVHRYVRGKMLGKGGFAKVYLCTALDTNKQYAVKIVPKANLVKARARQKLQAEIKIHRTLKHKHVCEYKHFFEDRNNCYILLELCHNQSMNEMIKRRKRLTEPEAAFFMTQLLQAVRYMHDINVIHRDLKLGNLFLDRNNHVKVGDLGLATRVEDKDEKRKTICGTPNYIAPEVIQGDKSKRGHSFEVDVWSMGVILYTILVGKPPYEAKDVKATYQRIINNEYSFPKHVDLSNGARDLIESMLQSRPSDRPSLDAIKRHRFLANNHIPDSLPAYAIHTAPVWRINDYGGIEPLDTLNNNSIHGRANGSIDSLRKPSIPRSSASGVGRSRQPFGFRDPNAGKNSVPGGGSVAASSIKQQDRGDIDMQRIVRSAMVMSGTEREPAASAKSRSSNVPSSKGSAASGFKIFDETERQSPRIPPSSSSKPSARKTAAATHPPSLAEDVLVQRTKALTIDGPSPKVSNLLRNPPAVSPSLSVSSSAVEAELLPRMIERLDAVLEITQCRKGSYSPSHHVPRPVSSNCGPKKWVTRYVDYTSKYGLGFLLNDGSSGVYFNDSTKTALEADGDKFQYIERRKVDDGSSDGAAVRRRADATVETFSLSSYPETLKKKVTLLNHFRNYLLEQQNSENDNINQIVDSATSASTNLVYVKKWVRTKHAILFRLSNQTVQVVFYDQSEILLTPDERYITYADKNLHRSTYSFTDELIGSCPELEKRAKYAREIISQLVNPSRR